jgi:hypothetical protein
LRAAEPVGGQQLDGDRLDRGALLADDLAGSIDVRLEDC